MRFAGYPFTVPRDSRSGNLSDVRIAMAASGLNHLEIARDPRDTSEKTYVIDRRIGDGPWRRLLTVDAFSEAPPGRLSEVRAVVEFEELPNTWGIEPEKTWGLPAGMESPWTPALEMIGNELLLPEEAIYISGDAPVNIARDNGYSNGRYGLQFSGERITVTDLYAVEEIALLSSDTSSLRWEEGTAGAAVFRGGSVYIEPAKPPLFMGTFSLDKDPIYVSPGLYEYGDHYLISSVEVGGASITGAFSIVKDPFPERWVPRVFCRAYVSLISPAHQPPLTEDEPERLSVRVEYPENDFPGIEPEVVTPYANKTGVFNSWDLEEGPVVRTSLERPYDYLVPFRRLEDWGGHPVWAAGDYYPALDFKGEESASYPTDMPFESPELPGIPEGTLFYRFQDSAYHNVISNEWIDVVYKEGYVYFENALSPEANGIGKITPTAYWNNVKVEWGVDTLFVNDEPAMIDELPWGAILDDGTWGETANIPPEEWTPSGDFPLDVEQYQEIPPTWVTGRPEGEVEIPPPDYSARPRTWGRLLFEDYSTFNRLIYEVGSHSISSIKD